MVVTLVCGVDIANTRYKPNTYYARKCFPPLFNEYENRGICHGLNEDCPWIYLLPSQSWAI